MDFHAQCWCKSGQLRNHDNIAEQPRQATSQTPLNDRSLGRVNRPQSACRHVAILFWCSLWSLKGSLIGGGGGLVCGLCELGYTHCRLVFTCLTHPCLPATGNSNWGCQTQQATEARSALKNLTDSSVWGLGVWAEGERKTTRLETKKTNKRGVHEHKRTEYARRSSTSISAWGWGLCGFCCYWLHIKD